MTTTPVTLHIDFVSDVACPWCAVGLNALERAIERIGPDIDVQVRMQPFELNPTMPAEGADAKQYLQSKYGMSDEQLAANRERIVALGAAAGFAFGPRERVWNTFDAHRLLAWAGAEGPAGSQRALKHALLQAYHGEGRNPGARDVLLDLAGRTGLPVARAAEVIDSDAFAADVREAERFWQDVGIQSVPATVIERRHLVSGGHPSETFEQVLRQMAAGAAWSGNGAE
jgi:predicted DsbA family dithiol-disulfide isomerase